MNESRHELTCPTDFLYHHFSNISQFKEDTEVTAHATKIFLEVIPYVGIAAGLIICHVGFKIVKPVCGLIGFVLGIVSAIIGLHLELDAIQNIICEVELVIMLLSGTAVAILTSCLVRFACFLIGAAGGVATTMLFFHIFPSLDRELWSHAPLFLGHTLVPYWVTMAVMAVACGYICKLRHKEVILVATTVIGSLTIALCMRHILIIRTRFSPHHAEIFFYSSFGLFALSGLIVQFVLYSNEHKKKLDAPSQRAVIRRSNSKSRREREKKDDDPREIEIVEIHR